MDEGFIQEQDRVWMLRRPEQPVMKTNGDGLMPPAKAGDVGFNIPVTEDCVVMPGQFARVQSGVRVELPAGCWGMIVARSGSNMRPGLVVKAGVIDQGFRGDLFAMVENVNRPTLMDYVRDVLSGDWLRRKLNIASPTTGRPPLPPGAILVKKGVAIQQLIVMPAVVPDLIRVAEIDTATERGTTGYGSTGASLHNGRAD